MPRSEGVGRQSGRIATEFIVIMLGVLLALAADRWNQARTDQATGAAYLVRFVEEIVADTASAAAYLRDRPLILSRLDSLIAFVDGGTPPPDLVATISSVTHELALSPAVAWREIQASNTLDVIASAELRKVLTKYYASREMTLLYLTRKDSRGRDPLFDNLFRTGLYDAHTEPGSPSELDPRVLREWPEMRPLLLSVGTAHHFKRFVAADLIRDAS
ncbi:MAG: hypothetical protein O2992_03400 [Gemmatimonadetes bacterium]|nr:hypothetical protein [Gemmatimonadota bacterium]